MKIKIAVSVLLIALALNASAKPGDSDVMVCEEIRNEAEINCQSEATSADQESCYQNEVIRMVDENNDETEDLSGGGELRCGY